MNGDQSFRLAPVLNARDGFGRIHRQNRIVLTIFRSTAAERPKPERSFLYDQLGKTKRSSDTMSPFSSTHSNRTDRRDFFCAKGDK
jgi:hypothetical protein